MLGVVESSNMPRLIAELRADGFWLSDELVAHLLEALGEAP